jgi:hypothetical protein
MQFELLPKKPIRKVGFEQMLITNIIFIFNLFYKSFKYKVYSFVGIRVYLHIRGFQIKTLINKII